MSERVKTDAAFQGFSVCDRDMHLGLGKDHALKLADNIDRLTRENAALRTRAESAESELAKVNADQAEVDNCCRTWHAMHNKKAHELNAIKGKVRDVFKLIDGAEWDGHPATIAADILRPIVAGKDGVG